MGWLDSQEKSLVNHLKFHSETSVEQAALKAASIGGALKQVGRIRSLRDFVSQTLAAERARAQASAS